jgi:hypothetical protein
MVISKPLLAVTILFSAACFPSPSSAADKPCAAVIKAGKLAETQPRIHSGNDLMRPARVDPSNKVPPLGEAFANVISIDKKSFVAMTSAMQFSEEGEKGGGMGRMVLHALIWFQSTTDACRLVGTATLAGRSVSIYETPDGNNNSDNPTDSILKFWIDNKTGLPVRMAMDEAMEKYVSPAKGGMAKGSKAVAPPKVFPERAITTYGFIFGDDVKTPIITGPEGTFGKTGKLDPAALALLKAIMSGRTTN